MNGLALNQVIHIHAFLSYVSVKNTWAFIWMVNLTFVNIFKIYLKKITKIISLLHKLQNNLPRAPLVTIYKSFVRPRPDYGDILYDQTFDNFFHERLESIQYNSALAITNVEAKKHLQCDWLRGVQRWPYLYSVFNICTLERKKKIKFDSFTIKFESLKNFHVIT